MENTENKLKNKMRIYEDQTQIPDFTKINQEPEWMKTLRAILEQRELTKTIQKTERRIFIDDRR